MLYKSQAGVVSTKDATARMEILLVGRSADDAAVFTHRPCMPARQLTLLDLLAVRPLSCGELLSLGCSRLHASCCTAFKTAAEPRRSQY